MIRFNNKGETIVEVLVILAIVSAVLGVAFASTTGNLNRSREAQERAEGNAIAQDRLERLKKIIASRSEAPTARFCVTESNTIVPIPATAGTNDIALDKFQDYPAGCVTGRYATFFTFNSAENLYTAHVRWDNASGESRDNIQVRYRTSFIANASPDPSAPATTTPLPTDPCPTAAPDNQFSECYYNRISFDEFVGSKFSGPSPNGKYYNWGTGSPAPNVEDDTFSTRWNGRFMFEARNYEFTINADDGVRVFVDGVKIMDRFNQQAPTTYRVMREMTAGWHTVSLEMYENTGLAVAGVTWGDVPITAGNDLVWVDLTRANLSDPKVASGKAFCWQVYETFAPGEGWDDNYLCSDTNHQITWSQSGVLSGQYCYRWFVPNSVDPDTWEDNYLCALNPLGLQFNYSGDIAGKSCIKIVEPKDTDGGIWLDSGTARLCESVETPTSPAIPASDVVEAETFGPSGGCNTVVSGGYQWCGGGRAGADSDTIDYQTIVVRARADYHAGWPIMTVYVDNVAVGTIQTNSTGYKDYYITGLKIASGVHNYAVSFDNDACCGSDPYTDRNLTVDKLTLYRDALAANIEGETLSTAPGLGIENDGAASAGRMMKFYSAGTGSKTVTTAQLNAITIRARGDQWQGSPQMTLRVDGSVIGSHSVISHNYQDYTFSGLNIAPGSHTISVSFDNDACGDANNPCGSQPNQDRNMIVDKIEFNPQDTYVNVMAGKTATHNGYVDSTYSSGTPSSTVDGNEGTVWYPGAWGYQVAADVRTARNLNAITAVWGAYGYRYSYTATEEVRYVTNYNIEYSSDGSNWISAGSGGMPGTYSTTVYGNFNNVRYIRVTASSNMHWIGIYEIKAY